MKGKLGGFLVGLIIAGSTSVASANPDGVPIADEAPLVCTTVDSRGGGNNYKVQAITANGEFPVVGPCPDGSGKTCSDYGYTVSSLNGNTISQSLFAISADQELHSASPSPAYVASPGDGDSTTAFLQYAKHEYPIRFNAQGTVFEGHIYIRESSTPRVGTAYIRGGKIDESCVIAGPGIPGDPWEAVTLKEDVVAAGGKCAATLHYNGNGKLMNISLPQGSPCFTGKVPEGALPAIGGEPVRSVGGTKSREVPITFGNGTTTVYLNSGWAICTAAPCPGDVTYVFAY